jgi:CBS domain-containing protein
MQLSTVLVGKGHHVVTVHPDLTVRELLAVLTEKSIGAVIVTSTPSEVLHVHDMQGIVSERDIVHALSSNPSALDSPVSTIMTIDVFHAPSWLSTDDVMSVMTTHRFRHVPVFEDDIMLGIVSIGDIVKARLGELELEKSALVDYIAGARS